MKERIKVTDANQEEVNKLIDDFCQSMIKYDVAIFTAVVDASEKPEFEVLVTSNLKIEAYPFLFKKVLKHSFPDVIKRIDNLILSKLDKKKNMTTVKSKKDFPS